MNKSTFDNLKSIKESTPTRISELNDRLESLKLEIKKNPSNQEKIEELRKTREELLSLRREFNRVKRYTEISGRELANGAIDLDNIPVSNLLRIDRDNKNERRGEFLSKSYLYKRSIDENGNIYEEPSDGNSLKEGDTLYVDLGKDTGKKSAYWKIGLGDMLSVDIGYIKVNGVIGVRAIINGRVGYYAKPSSDGYIPVFSGSIVTIPTTSEVQEFTKTQSPDLKRNASQEENDKANDMRIERLERSPESSNVELNSYLRESYDFWKGKGFSEEQIAGLLANEYKESQGNPNAEGDKDPKTGIFKAKGIFQWHPERRAVILKNTGIEIENASHKQQLEAAWWEMTQESFEKRVYPLIKSAQTADETARIISQTYLRPKDESGEMKERGEMSANIFNQYRFINNPELAKIAEGEANKKILELALSAQSKGDILNAEHCTDWVDKIYREATGKTVYRNSLYNGISGTKIQKGTGYHGVHATGDQLNIIQPGNHLIVDHMEDGEFSQGRTHSVIALSRPINGIVEVVSYPNNRILPRIEKYDLLGQGREKNGKVLRIQSV